MMMGLRQPAGGHGAKPKPRIRLPVIEYARRKSCGKQIFVQSAWDMQVDSWLLRYGWDRAEAI